MVETMYKEEIMELYSEKPNFGNLETKTHEAKQKNLICDDEIKLELEIKDNKIINAKFSGKTCFVSTISASKLTEKIKGMKIQEAQKLNKEDLDKLLGIDITPTRLRCELLALEALKKIKC